MGCNRKSFFILLVILTWVIVPSCQGQKGDVVAEPQSTQTAAPAAASVEEQQVEFNGREETYILRIPGELDLTQPAPLILIFHGMGDTPQTMFKAGFGPIADREGIILAYPYLPSHTSTEFIGLLLSDLDEKVKIDPGRIYAMGFSLGGKLAYHAACDLSNTIAAFAAVSGMAICEAEHASDRAVPILHIHGLGDELVPFETGKFGMPPGDETIAYWADFNGCESSPQKEVTGAITHSSYRQCRDGGAVELYTIEQLGHKVPIQELSSAEIIWEFFQAHPLGE